MERIGGSAPFTTCRWDYLLYFTNTKFVPLDEVSSPRQRQASVDISVFALGSWALLQKADYPERRTLRIFEDRESPYPRNFLCRYQNTTTKVPCPGD
jgi:hypothetical protein